MADSLIKIVNIDEAIIEVASKLESLDVQHHKISIKVDKVFTKLKAVSGKIPKPLTMELSRTASDIFNLTMKQSNLQGAYEQLNELKTKPKSLKQVKAEQKEFVFIVNNISGIVAKHMTENKIGSKSVVDPLKTADEFKNLNAKLNFAKGTLAVLDSVAEEMALKESNDKS